MPGGDQRHRTIRSVKRHMAPDWKTPEIDGKTYAPGDQRPHPAEAQARTFESLPGGP